MPALLTRPVPAAAFDTLSCQGLPPLLARLFAARGVAARAQLDYDLSRLLPPSQLKNAEAMAVRLADAIASRAPILVVADYDADGATACALAVKGLTALGARVDFLVPNRFEYGYGLTPEIVALAAQRAPKLILTVDNGMSSAPGVEAARERGIEVLITDHHLPADTLPAALIVNPNQAGCTFPSKSLAGVGVMFYVLIALRTELRRRGAFAQQPAPNLAAYLDIVALGTVADVVKLDDNNRILVEQGLQRIRQGKACAGVAALFTAAGRTAARATAFDLGFMIGPRLNAAGRLDDMSVGIHCLLATDPRQAQAYAAQLDALNRERRSIEAGMQAEALAHLADFTPEDRATLTLYRDDWHQGVVGIVASRLKERYHRPVMVFAPSDAGEVKGSGRSIPGFHLRDAVDWVDKHHPGLILKFGGHAMAAGLTLTEAGVATFTAAFEAVGQAWLTAAQLTRTLETDGSLPTADLHLATAELLGESVWGQGFPAPAFVDRFSVVSQRVVGEKHLKLQLAREGAVFEAMLFNQNAPLPQEIEAVYQLNVNEWRGARLVQLFVDYWQEG